MSELKVNKFNVPVYQDILRDMISRQSGSFIFTLKVNSGLIVDYFSEATISDITKPVLTVPPQPTEAQALSLSQVERGVSWLTFGQLTVSVALAGGEPIISTLAITMTKRKRYLRNHSDKEVS